MIDIGSPFSMPFLELLGSLRTSLVEGVEQTDCQEVVFQKETRFYPLKNAASLTRLADHITGVVNGKPAIFASGVHYNLQSQDGTLRWEQPSNQTMEATWYPDNGSRLRVEYTYRGMPSGLSDFNQGSVADTLLRALARELKLLYEQMDQAYRRAFVDYASGAALDNVVALLGITRNQAIASQGQVTFSRNRKASQPILIAAGTRVSDARGRLYKVIAPGTIQPGNLEVTLPVMAIEPGPEGDVAANSLSIMPTPPRGVDKVTNLTSTSGGKAAESDEALRERAKHALEQAGNATLSAIRYAVLNVDEVDGVDVRDHSIDNTIPLGEVWIRYAAKHPDSKELLAQVTETVERTRSAGIKARVTAVVPVFIGGVIYVIPEAEVPDLDSACARCLSAFKDAISTLGIGQPLVVRRLVSHVYKISGLTDVAEPQLSREPSQGLTNPIRTDIYQVQPHEQLRPLEGEGFKVTPLQSLDCSLTITDPGIVTLSVSVQDHQRHPVLFRDFSLKLLIRFEIMSADGNRTWGELQHAEATFNSSAQSSLTFANEDHLHRNESGQIVLLHKGQQLPMDKGQHIVAVAIQAMDYPGIRAISKQF